MSLDDAGDGIGARDDEEDEEGEAESATCSASACVARDSEFGSDSSCVTSLLCATALVVCASGCMAAWLCAAWTVAAATSAFGPGGWCAASCAASLASFACLI